MFFSFLVSHATEKDQLFADAETADFLYLFLALEWIWGLLSTTVTLRFFLPAHLSANWASIKEKEKNTSLQFGEAHYELRKRMAALEHGFSWLLKDVSPKLGSAPAEVWKGLLSLGTRGRLVPPRNCGRYMVELGCHGEEGMCMCARPA